MSKENSNLKSVLETVGVVIGSFIFAMVVVVIGPKCATCVFSPASFGIRSFVALVHSTHAEFSCSSCGWSCCGLGQR